MKESSQTDWHRLKTQKDWEIDYLDIPETDEDFWSNAEIIFPTKKVHLSIRLDEDIVTWFKQFGRGYQTRINSILRSYVQSVAKRNKEKVKQT